MGQLSRKRQEVQALQSLLEAKGKELAEKNRERSKLRGELQARTDEAISLRLQLVKETVNGG